MTEENFMCLSCQNEFTLHRHRRTRWLLTGAGAVIGTAVTGSVLGGALTAAVTYGVVSAIDEYQAHHCPECHAATFPPKRSWRERRRGSNSEAATYPH